MQIAERDHVIFLLGQIHYWGNMVSYSAFCDKENEYAAAELLSYEVQLEPFLEKYPDDFVCFRALDDKNNFFSGDETLSRALEPIWFLKADIKPLDGYEILSYKNLKNVDKA